LTYAANLESISAVSKSSRYSFEQVDICNADEITHILNHYQPDAIMHLAAESHVDRSIAGPVSFIQTNIMGTYTLLEAVRTYWQSLAETKKHAFRFQHISTDEVYGSLDDTDDFFTENTAYAPSSPYSASKASADHLVRAWHRTYGLPTLISNCSNNYGPYQFPEKLIPLTILNALAGKPIPVYGNGRQIRDWLYVEDHVRALYLVLTEGQIGSTYAVSGCNEKMNLDVVSIICTLLEEMAPDKPWGLGRYQDLITYIQDRPGHDIRYAINASKIKNELGWVPLESFATGMQKTVQWYLENREQYQDMHLTSLEPKKQSIDDKEPVL